MRRDNAYDMGGLSEYDQGYEDGRREMEREAMALVSILVRRLGGMVIAIGRSSSCVQSKGCRTRTPRR